MKIKLVLLFAVFSSLYSFSQEISVVSLLDKDIQETSGLLLLNGKLITHNDSGSKPILFEFDSLSGKITRSVFVKNAKNVDWEDITADEDFIYIGDIGNNRGKRERLRIYRIKIADYLVQDSVVADKFKISYADQKIFKPGKFLTNYDAETLISIGDSLYIFSKNWGNRQTRMYSLPKIPGTYELIPKASFNSKCMVTGGDYNKEKNEIVLIGYLYNKQIIMRLDGFGLDNVSLGNFRTTVFKVPENSSKQIEGIVHFKGYEYFISAEEYQGNSQVLYKLKWNP
jgi:hypothetical protein